MSDNILEKLDRHYKEDCCLVYKFIMDELLKFPRKLDCVYYYKRSGKYYAFYSETEIYRFYLKRRIKHTKKGLIYESSISELDQSDNVDVCIEDAIYINNDQVYGLFDVIKCIDKSNFELNRREGCKLMDMADNTIIAMRDDYLNPVYYFNDILKIFFDYKDKTDNSAFYIPMIRS